MPDVLGAECRPQKPIAVLMINGTADQIVPYAGGMVQPGNAFNAWSAERLVGFFRELNGCAATAEQSVLPNTTRNQVEIARWTRCASAPVAFYRVVGSGHGAPRDLDAGQVLLDFFRANAP
jgi:polyhydroxybutyrate depolymerase